MITVRFLRITLSDGASSVIKPTVVRLVRDSFDRKDWIFEIKWDGFRAIAETDRTDGLKLHSRN